MLEHIVSVAGDESVKVFFDAALRPVATVVTNAVRRRFHLPGDDIEELRLEIQRIDETLETLGYELQQRTRDGVTAEQLNAEAAQPSFKRFAERAFDVAANSTLESKRRLAGSLIARRLQVHTDTKEEIQLRRALFTIEDLTENQLRMLAAAHLVIFGPPLDPEHATFTSRDALEACLKLRFSSLIHELYDTLRLDEDDFGALASVGALRLTEDSRALLFHEHAPAFDMWMQQRGVDPYDGLEGDWGSAESHDAFRTRFPTVNLLSALAAGKSRSNTGENIRRLDDLLLTPLGEAIAQLVLQQMLDSGASVETATTSA
ncbi:MAG: hypothetical protein ACYDDQ_01975 [Vulcanimicrobiaceae bacterium]